MHMLAHFCTHTPMDVSMQTINGDVILFQADYCLHSLNNKTKIKNNLYNHVGLFLKHSATKQPHRKLSSLASCVDLTAEEASFSWQRTVDGTEQKGFFGVVITGEGWKGGRRKRRRMSDCWLVLFNWFPFASHLSFRCTLTFLEADLQIFIISQDLLDHPQWVFLWSLFSKKNSA